MSNPLDRVIQHLSRLPGIGERTATRLAFHIWKSPPAFRHRFAEALAHLDRIHLCSMCCNITETDPCTICQSPVRDHQLICVVEKACDIYSIERLQSYRGLYHVLHGLLSPMDGIGPQDIKLAALFQRIRETPPKELIVALSPTLEGDATAQFIVKQLQHLDLPITRLASGLAVGSDLEYADQITLGKAFEARTRLR